MQVYSTSAVPWYHDSLRQDKARVIALGEMLNVILDPRKVILNCQKTLNPSAILTM